jgi:hypothetical protein
MARPQVADGEDALQVWWVVANILNKLWRTAEMGGPPARSAARGTNNSSP